MRPPPGPAGPRRGDPRPRLLLVGGTADELEIYEAGLSANGFDVRTLRELAGLGAAIVESRPSIVVFNLELGSEDVWRELETVSCGAALGVPGILLTAWIREDGRYRARARESGCAAFIAKPCTPDTLADLARTVIAGVRGLSVAAARRFRIAEHLAGSSPNLRDAEEMLVSLMRAEFREMPGLRLTAEQASRLWGAPAWMCDTALQRLVDDRVLHRTRGGAYVRVG